MSTLREFLETEEPFKDHNYRIENPRKHCFVITKLVKTPRCPEVKLLRAKNAEIEEINNTIKSLSEQLVFLDNQNPQSVA